jgi:hypothetical protein
MVSVSSHFLLPSVSLIGYLVCVSLSGEVEVEVNGIHFWKSRPLRISGDRHLMPRLFVMIRRSIALNQRNSAAYGLAGGMRIETLGV